jgi:hypothetical protein
MSVQKGVGPYVFCSKGCRFSRNEVTTFLLTNVINSYGQRQSFPLKPYKFTAIITAIKLRALSCCMFQRDFTTSTVHTLIHVHGTAKMGSSWQMSKLHNGYTMVALCTPAKEISYSRTTNTWEKRCMFLDLFELRIPEQPKSSTKRAVIIVDVFNYCKHQCPKDKHVPDNFAKTR